MLNSFLQLFACGLCALRALQFVGWRIMRDFYRARFRWGGGFAEGVGFRWRVQKRVEGPKLRDFYRARFKWGGGFAEGVGFRWRVQKRVEGSKFFNT